MQCLRKTVPTTSSRVFSSSIAVMLWASWSSLGPPNSVRRTSKDTAFVAMDWRGCEG